jgi:hypothetical protein
MNNLLSPVLKRISYKMFILLKLISFNLIKIRAHLAYGTKRTHWG